LRCAVAKEELLGDVQENAVVVLVRVAQRTVWHEEEIRRGQPEGVRPVFASVFHNNFF